MIYATIHPRSALRDEQLRQAALAMCDAIRIYLASKRDNDEMYRDASDSDIWGRPNAQASSVNR